MKQFFFILSIICLPIMAISQITFTTSRQNSLYEEDGKWICSPPLYEETIWQIQVGRIYSQSLDDAYFKIKTFATRGKNDIYICEDNKGNEVVIVVLDQGKNIVVNFKGYGKQLAMVYEVKNIDKNKQDL
jgi:hypothetical protein